VLLLESQQSAPVLHIGVIRLFEVPQKLWHKFLEGMRVAEFQTGVPLGKAGADGVVGAVAAGAVMVDGFG